MKNLKDVECHDMPRVSNILLNYYAVLYKLARYYYDREQAQEVTDIVDFMQRNMRVKTLPGVEKIIESIENYGKK